MESSSLSNGHGAPQGVPPQGGVVNQTNQFQANVSVALPAGFPPAFELKNLEEVARINNAGERFMTMFEKQQNSVLEAKTAAIRQADVALEINRETTRLHDKKLANDANITQAQIDESKRNHLTATRGLILVTCVIIAGIVLEVQGYVIIARMLLSPFVIAVLAGAYKYFHHGKTPSVS